MVVHICQICYKKFSKKSAYVAHMTRKVKCEPIESSEDFINNESNSPSSSNSLKLSNSRNPSNLETNKYIKKLENRIQELESDMRYVLNVLSSTTSPIRFNPFDPPTSSYPSLLNPYNSAVNRNNQPSIYDFDKIGSHSLN